MNDFIILFGRRVGRDTMTRFKREYEMAVARGEQRYKFDGHDVLVSFAKYVLQYAENEMGAL